MRLSGTALLLMIGMMVSAFAQENPLDNPGFEDEFGPNSRWNATVINQTSVVEDRFESTA